MAKDETPPQAAVMPAARRERRGQKRIAVGTKVRVKTDQETLEVVTENITRNGMFLRTEWMANLRDLIQLEVDLGPDGTLETVAVVRHVIRPKVARRLGIASGLGVQLYGLSATDRQRWDSYVRRVGRLLGFGDAGASTPGVRPERREATAPEDPAESASVSTPGVRSERDESSTPGFRPDRPTRSTPSGKSRQRRSETPFGDPVVGLDAEPTKPVGGGFAASRQEVTRPSPQQKPLQFTVRFRDEQSMTAFRTRDLTLGGFFLATDVEAEVGMPVVVRVLHPETGGAFFFDCEVLNSGSRDRAGRAGLGLRFVDLTDEMQRDFDEFARAGAVDVDLDLDDWLTDE